jgi:hypothetical protein
MSILKILTMAAVAAEPAVVVVVHQTVVKIIEEVLEVIKCVVAPGEQQIP